MGILALDGIALQDARIITRTLPSRLSIRLVSPGRDLQAGQGSNRQLIGIEQNAPAHINKQRLSSGMVLEK
jgi:hypothetical protein